MNLPPNKDLPRLLTVESSRLSRIVWVVRLRCVCVVWASLVVDVFGDLYRCASRFLSLCGSCDLAVLISESNSFVSKSEQSFDGQRTKSIGSGHVLLSSYFFTIIVERALELEWAGIFRANRGNCLNQKFLFSSMANPHIPCTVRCLADVV